MRWVLLFIFCIYSSLVKIAYAIPDNESIPEYNPANNLKVTGYADGSYNYLLHSNKFISNVFNRSNDVQENGFTLQQITFTLAKEPDQGFGGLGTFMLGRDAYINTPTGIDPNVFGMKDIGLGSPQAYLRYQKDADTFKLGLLQTLVGYENFDYSGEFNYSFSILNGYAQPGSHMGFRFLHKFNDRISLTVGSANGWNTVKQTYKQNNVEVALNYAKESTFSLMMDVQSGYQYLTDALASGPTYWRNIIDIYGDLSVTNKLTIAGNYDYGLQTKALLPNGTIARTAWHGMAFYVNYAFTKQWRTAFRGEIFEDPDGYRTGVKQNWREITLTIGYQPIKALMIFAETRHDFSNVNAFLKKNGIGTSKNQQSYALNVYYQFL